MKKLLLIILTSCLVVSCGYRMSPRVEVIQDVNSDCTYIANIDTLLKTYVIHKPEVNYGLDLGYAGYTIGGELKEHRQFVALQTKLNQQGAAINSMIKAIIIQGNKSCNPQIQALVWKTFNNLINTLAVTYAPVLLEKAEQGISESVEEYLNPEVVEVEPAKRLGLDFDNILRMRDILDNVIGDSEENNEDNVEDIEPEVSE